MVFALPRLEGHGLRLPSSRFSAGLTCEGGAHLSGWPHESDVEATNGLLGTIHAAREHDPTVELRSFDHRLVSASYRLPSLVNPLS